MFHDSMAIAQEKMTRVCQFLELHVLPPSPLNYSVIYQYISKKNPNLNTEIDRALKQRQTIDCLYIEQLYFEFMNTAHQAETAIVNNVDNLLGSLSRNAKITEQEVIQFADQVNDCVHSLDENNVAKSRQALNTFSNKTAHILNQHKQFKLTLTKAKQLHRKTQKQLTMLRKQHITDQQTGLYKRHFLNQQTQLWLNQNKSICVIAIQIDNLDHFINNYGDVIGEAILSKVAKQIKKYVFESGLPGRTGKGEFTVLLADIDPETANIIAEKVRTGVEKLRFVSSKSETKLPTIDISLGIAKHHDEVDFNKLARKASLAAHKAKSLGQSSFIAGQ